MMSLSIIASEVFQVVIAPWPREPTRRGPFLGSPQEWPSKMTINSLQRHWTNSQNIWRHLPASTLPLHPPTHPPHHILQTSGRTFYLSNQPYLKLRQGWPQPILTCSEIQLHTAWETRAAGLVKWRLVCCQRRWNLNLPVQVREIVGQDNKHVLVTCIFKYPLDSLICE